jgi:hypothetical protein
VAYWLAFAAFTLDAARNPGFVMHPEEVPYPWGAALTTVALLGVQTAALNAVLMPLRTTRSWRRVAGASALAFLFALLSVVTAVTDMPGYYYAPELFALTNLFVVPLLGLAFQLSPRTMDAPSDLPHD